MEKVFIVTFDCNLPMLIKFFSDLNLNTNLLSIYLNMRIFAYKIELRKVKFKRMNHFFFKFNSSHFERARLQKHVCSASISIPWFIIFYFSFIFLKNLYWTENAIICSEFCDKCRLLNRTILNTLKFDRSLHGFGMQKEEDRENASERETFTSPAYGMQYEWIKHGTYIRWDSRKETIVIAYTYTQRHTHTL